MLPDSTSLASITPAIPGLVWAYHFHSDARRCTALPLDAARSDLDIDEGFLWLHLNLADMRVAGFWTHFPE